MLLYKETCVTQAVDRFTSGRKEMQSTNEELSTVPPYQPLLSKLKLPSHSGSHREE